VLKGAFPTGEHQAGPKMGLRRSRSDREPGKDAMAPGLRSRRVR